MSALDPNSINFKSKDKKLHLNEKPPKNTFFFVFLNKIFKFVFFQY